MCNQTIFNINNRNFDPCLFSIIVFSTNINFKNKDGIISEREVYVFFSCNVHAKRKFLTAVFTDQFSKTSDWYDFLLSFKNRSLSHLFYAVIPNNSFLSKAFKLVFNDVQVFITHLDTFNKISKYFPYSFSSSLLENIKKLYLSNNLNDFNVFFTDFKNEFLSIPFIFDLLSDDLSRIKSYYSFDYDLRSFIFSFYFQRETIKKINVISHSKHVFFSIDEFISLLIPLINTIESRMFCTKNQLTLIINKIYNDKKDLLKLYL